MKSSQSPLDKKIERATLKLANEKRKLSKLRKKRPLELVADYTLRESNGKPVRLSQLFGKKNELIWIHNMGASCPYCTLWADGFKGLQPHLENRAALVLESPDLPATQTKFAKKRGWTYRMVSSRGTTFRQDLGYSTKDGDPIPGLSTFVKKGAKIYRVAHAQLGPGDSYCVQWDLLDLLPAKEWHPQFRY